VRRHRDGTTTVFEPPGGASVTRRLDIDLDLQCAAKARITSGRGFHPENCRLLW
jgi:hypothetical protein